MKFRFSKNWRRCLMTTWGWNFKMVWIHAGKGHQLQGAQKRTIKSDRPFQCNPWKVHDGLTNPKRNSSLHWCRRWPCWITSAHVRSHTTTRFNKGHKAEFSVRTPFVLRPRDQKKRFFLGKRMVRTWSVDRFEVHKQGRWIKWILFSHGTLIVIILILTFPFLFLAWNVGWNINDDLLWLRS